MDNNIAPVSSKKTIRLLTILLSISFLVILGLVGFFFYQSNYGSSAKTFEVSNVDPNVLNKLEGTIVYADANQSKEQSYYSSSLQLTFKYDDSALNISEGSKAVYINFASASDVYPILKLSSSSDIKGKFLDESYLDSLTFKEEKKEGDISYLLFTYKEASFVDATKKTDRFLTVIYKSLEDSKTAYIEIPKYNYTEREDVKYFVQILASISTDLSGIEKNAVAKIGESVSIPFDMDVWSISYQSDNYISLTTSSSNNTLSGGINITTNSAYKEYNESVLDTELKQSLEQTKKFYTEDMKGYTFETLKEPETRTISGIPFRLVSYKYKNIESDYSYTYIKALGYLPGSQKTIEITANYDSKKLKTSEEIEKLLNEITIEDKELYSTTKIEGNNNVLGANSVSLNASTILAQTSSVRLFARNCVKATFPNAPTNLAISGKTYDVCSAGLGTGFAVDSNGHFVTNAHVADPNQFDIFENGFVFNPTLVSDLLEAVKVIIGNNTSLQYYFMTDPYKTTLYINYYMYKEGMLEITKGDSEVYIQGNSSFEISEQTLDLINKSSHILTTLKDSYTISSSYEAAFSEEEVSIDQPDLALIQSSSGISFPNLTAPAVDAIAGEDIYVVGYPGISDNKQLFDISSKVNSTVTKGTISALRDNPSKAFKLVQVDASIDHGNSGGPIINSIGNFVGVATYGIGGSESGNYNAGIYYSTVLDMLAKNNVSNTANPTRDSLESGLDKISKSHYKLALKDLEDVKGANDTIANVIDPLIELCNSKIEAGEDKSPIIAFDFITIPNWALFLMIGIFFVLIIVVVLIIILNRKKDTPQSDSTNVQTTQPTQPVTTPDFTAQSLSEPQEPQIQQQEIAQTYETKPPMQQPTIEQGYQQQNIPVQQAPTQNTGTPPATDAGGYSNQGGTQFSQ